MNSDKLNTTSAIMDRPWIVGSFDTLNGLSFSAFPVMHETEAQAKAEATRLACNTAGKTYVWVRLAGGVEKGALRYI